MKITLLFSLIFVFQSALSQSNDYTAKTITPISDPFQNPVILSHYPSVELQYIKDNDPDKFNTIVYYYTKSFVLEKFPCTDCVAYDANTFDVFNFEKFRLKDKRYVRTFDKYGGRLILLATDELEYKLPIHIE